MLEESASPAVDTLQEKLTSPKEDENSTNSEPATDTEDQDMSDDDDDRNHKHRRREAEPQSLEENASKQSIERPNRKRNRPFEKGQFSAHDSQGEEQRGYSSKFKRCPGMIPTNRGPLDSGPRSRVNQSRGRGRNKTPWNQHDPRFNPLAMMDFASQMASQALPTHLNIYMGTGLPNGASLPNGYWGPYGFVPGIGNGILNPIHPLGLQGALQSTLSPLISLGMPHQRCIDFEERGFCLRGDICPMEHGVNRIVVDDMQSLSQFNLPVTNALGIHNETGTAPPVSGSSSLAGSKAAGTKDTESVLTNDLLKLNGIADPAAAEGDVYDPDQPLWNNERSSALRFPSSNIDAKQLWNADLLVNEGNMGEYTDSGFADEVGLQNTKSSIWGRINSRGKKGSGKLRSQRTKGSVEIPPVTVQGKRAAGNDQTSSRMLGDVGSHSSHNSQKASRTLYVNGIPLECNRWEILLAHFQKFGRVIDIYIPTNSEKAFVQFSKREEAEAALKSPDAVIGNRFIKLWWANRDRISDEGETHFSKLTQSPNLVDSSVPCQPSPSKRGKENVQSTSTKVITGSFVVASDPTTAPTKSAVANGLTAIPSVPKKPESLELVEELRKKQEALAQKRAEFRRQLEKLARQASLKKGEAVGKGDVATLKEAGPETVNQNKKGIQAQTGGHALDKKNSSDLPSPAARDPAATTQKSAMAMKQTTPVSAPLPNRFKLDNRTTSFRVLAPLPAEITDVSMLEDHFSSFGDLSSVVLEDTEAHNQEGNLKPSLSCSACVTYTTRQSAESAFFGGRSCKAHTLRFMWLTASPGSNGRSGPQATSVPTKASSSELQVEKVTSELSPAGGKLVSGTTSSTAADGVSESLLKTESRNTVPFKISEAAVQTSSCSSSSVSSNANCPAACDATEDVEVQNADPQ